MCIRKLVALVIVGSMAGFLACSSGPKARLTEWRDPNFTICCLADRCSDKDWVQAAKGYCSGTVSMIGGQIQEGVSGYSTEKGKGGVLQVQPVMGTRQCRTFKCDGTILAPR